MTAVLDIESWFALDLATVGRGEGAEAYWPGRRRSAIADLACLPGQVDNVVLCARDPALEGTFSERRYERANTLRRPGSTLHSTTVRPWSSTKRVREFVS
jgi:hypothetical protein